MPFGSACKPGSQFTSAGRAEQASRSALPALENGLSLGHGAHALCCDVRSSAVTLLPAVEDGQGVHVTAPPAAKLPAAHTSALAEPPLHAWAAGQGLHAAEGASGASPATHAAPAARLVQAYCAAAPGGAKGVSSGQRVQLALEDAPSTSP